MLDETKKIVAEQEIKIKQMENTSNCIIDCFNSTGFQLLNVNLFSFLS
jgi:hypothetical protein